MIGPTWRVASSRLLRLACAFQLIQSRCRGISTEWVCMYIYMMYGSLMSNVADCSSPITAHGI
jgi:hypothetical protein